MQSCSEPKSQTPPIKLWPGRVITLENCFHASSSRRDVTAVATRQELTYHAKIRLIGIYLMSSISSEGLFLHAGTASRARGTGHTDQLNAAPVAARHRLRSWWEGNARDLSQCSSWKARTLFEWLDGNRTEAHEATWMAALSLAGAT